MHGSRRSRTLNSPSVFHVTDTFFGKEMTQTERERLLISLADFTGQQESKLQRMPPVQPAPLLGLGCSFILSLSIGSYISYLLCFLKVFSAENFNLSYSFSLPSVFFFLYIQALGSSVYVLYLLGTPRPS